MDRLIFNEIWPMIEGDDSDDVVPEGAVAAILEAPTIDVHAFDALGAVIARKRGELGSQLRAGLAPAEWYDKRWMADRLVEIGVPGPDVWDEPVASEFPVIVKARITSAGMGVRICHNQAEVDQAWAELGGSSGKAFMQQYLAGPTYATTGIAKEGEVLVHETYRMIPAPGDPTGPSLHQEMVHRPELDENVRRIIRDVNLTGIFNLQQIVDEEGRGRTFDLNPRCPTAFAGLSVAGSALYSTYLSLLEGVEPTAGASLPEGTIASAVRLAYMEDWEDLAAFRAWLRYTGQQIRARRATQGARFVLWAYATRTRLILRGAKRAMRRSRAVPSHVDVTAAPSEATQPVALQR